MLTKCKSPLSGASPRFKRNKHESGSVFTSNGSSLFRKDHEKAEFEVHEVYAVDVLISTGEGKVRAGSSRSPAAL